MSDDEAFEALLAAIAGRTPVDWENAERRADSDADRVRLAALKGIERIASHSHDEWRRAAPGAGQAAAAGEASALEPAAGRVLGAYTLESPIGHGGMGEVWSARRSDGRFEGRVAVKLLLLPLVSRHGRGRFQREGEILARLRHPNIAHLLDAGLSPAGQPYLVLEYVNGSPIDRHCDESELGVRERVRLFLGVLAAVAHAHANLVLHRDLKPSNIFVDREGQVKLLDFGVAKLIEDEAGAAAETEVTRRAGPAFTPEFASPEQVLGEPVTTSTDVWSAGAVLYLLLAGRRAADVPRGAPPGRLRLAFESEPRPASVAVGAAAATAAQRRARELRGDLDNILARALKRVPAERYANADAFADDLRRWLRGDPVAARADSLGYRAGKFVRRHLGAVAAASVAVLALAAVTVVAVVEGLEARRQRDEAREQARRADAFTSVVTSLLSQVGPGGRALTSGELLDHAVTEMKARYAADPAFLVSMLIRISGRWYDLQDSKKELATLVEAERVARAAKDPALVFDVQVNTVETELALGRLREATQRIEEARRLLPGLKPQPDLEDYLRAEAKLARANGDTQGAIGYLERARALLESRGGTTGNSYPGILSELALSHAMLGNLRERHAIGRAILELDRRLGRANSMPGILSRGSFAYATYEVGDVRGARGQFEEFVRPDSAGRGILPSIALAYADVLSRLGAHDRARAILAGAVPASTAGGGAAVAIRAGLVQARVFLRSGRAEEATRALEAVDAAIAADEAPRLGWRVEAARMRAEAERALGRNDDALRDAQAALELLGYPAKRHGPGLPASILTLASVRLGRGETAAAIAAAREAEELFAQDALDPRRSADVGEAALVLARAALAGGAREEALAGARRAAECLREGLGADHERTREAEALLAKL